MEKVLERVYDFSVHNGVIDWTTLKTSGVEFVMLRAGYGKNNVDQRFYENANACVKNDIPFGIYWFSYAYTVEMAEKEADYALAAVEKYKMKCPVSFDLEYDTVKYAATKGILIGKTLATEMARAFCSRIQNAGFEAWNYANRDYLQNMFDSSLLQEYPLWYARYNTTNERTDMVMWQYSSKGRLPGVKGNVDCNISYRILESVTKTGQQDEEITDPEVLEAKEGIGTYSYQLEGAYYLALNGNKTNFRVREFQCKDRSDRILIDRSLLEILQQIRTGFGATVTITSGYRSESYNTKVGGARASYHIAGQAADIKVSGVAPLKVASYAESINVLGIGLYTTSNFTHVDTRSSKYYWLNQSGNKVTTFGISVTPGKPPAGTVLKKGMANTYVRWLQTALNQKAGSELKVDGIFGSLTEQAVKKYQEQQCLCVDGKAGDITIESLAS